jgi:hypothetical protein
VAPSAFQHGFDPQASPARSTVRAPASVSASS